MWKTKPQLRYRLTQYPDNVAYYNSETFITKYISATKMGNYCVYDTVANQESLTNCSEICKTCKGYRE